MNLIEKLGLENAKALDGMVESQIDSRGISLNTKVIEHE